MLDLCEGPSYSFIPYNDGNPSSIDHICVHETLLSDVIQCSVSDDAPLNISRHLPLFMTIQLPSAQSYTSVIPEGGCAKSSYNWSKPNEREQYRLKLSNQLQAVTFDYTNVDSTYDSIVQCITVVAEECVSKRVFKPYLKPYWNNELKRLHAVNRQKRAVWINSGRPRSNDSPSYRDYKDANRQFSAENENVC